ncbi:MAG: formylglycine-generating enzyme family protein [Gammaproteobacteria bacterium]|nr:formylglycine-generating enzyme family protein [Gammaproteobacteria bacterium]
MAQPYQLESRRLGAQWTRGFAVHLSLLVFVAVFGVGAAQAEFDDEEGDDDVERVVVGSPRVGIPQSGGSESETRQKVTIELPDRDANVCRSDPTRGPEMVVIEGGHFWMGSLYGDSDEKPVHKVAVQPFALGRCEVTVAEFSVFVEDTGHVATADSGDCRAVNEEGTTFVDGVDASWRNPRYPEVAQVAAMPVVCVSFDDALAYTQWLAARTGRPYRLPTEAEWEYAARGGTTTPRYWEVYRRASQCDFANGADQDAKSRFTERSSVECADGHVVSAPVGTYRPNAYGLYDMMGNVWEWTADCWHGAYDEAAPEEGDCSQRVVRGGSWFYGPMGLRSAKRSKDDPARTYNSVGFRVARTH